LADSKPLEEVLDLILKASPSLANLFAFGLRASNPFKTREVEQTEKPYEGKRFPTYFKFKGKDAGVELERQTHKNLRSRIAFETDADNDYFSRKLEAGDFTLSRVDGPQRTPAANFVGPLLHNGIATLSVKIPEETPVGSTIEYVAVVTDPYREDPFENRFTVVVKPEAEIGGGGGTRRKPPGGKEGAGREQPGGIALPNIIEVAEDQWNDHEFDRNTALVIKDAGSDEKVAGENAHASRFDFFINIDNIYLKSEMKSLKADAPLLKAPFTYGLVLIGLGLLQQDMAGHSGADGNCDSEENGNGIREGVEARVARVTSAVAPIILPMIESLGSLELDTAESSALAGEAT